MRTLYDVLGLSPHANASQIEHAYRHALTGIGDTPDELIRAKAIGEAYSVLGSETRRSAYDARQRHKQAPPVPVVNNLLVDEGSRNWWPIIILGVVLLAGFSWYKVQSQRAEAVRVALEAVRAAEAAKEAERLADAAETRLAHQLINDRRRADEQRAREIERLRSDSGRSYTRYYQEPAVLTEEQRREQAFAKAKEAQAREEYQARLRNEQQTMAMKRALDIPIVRH